MARWLQNQRGWIKFYRVALFFDTFLRLESSIESRYIFISLPVFFTLLSIKFCFHVDCFKDDSLFLHVLCTVTMSPHDPCNIRSPTLGARPMPPTPRTWPRPRETRSCPSAWITCGAPWTSARSGAAAPTPSGSGSRRRARCCPRQSTVSMFQGKEMDNKKEFRIIFGLEFFLE